MDDQALRTCICETGRELLENGLVARTWGNVSARADGEHYLVTPSGMDYGSIAPEDIALCDLATGKWTGPRRPSGERAVRALSVESRSTREVIEWRDIYKKFERCFNAAEALADAAETAVLKNS